MMDKFTQFINDKFQYSQSVAMEILVQSGLKEQLFELAKVRNNNFVQFIQLLCIFFVLRLIVNYPRYWSV